MHILYIIYMCLCILFTYTVFGYVSQSLLMSKELVC